MSDQNVPEPVDLMKQRRDYVAIKVPQFSWTRLPGADPFLGVGKCLYRLGTSAVFVADTQKWHLRVRSPLSEKTSTRHIGQPFYRSMGSSFLDHIQVFFSVETPTDQKWLLSLPTSCG
jgi:hypothetical protein